MARLQYDPEHDYYEVLGLASDADAASVQRMFRQKAKQLHPDVNPHQSAWAKEQFQHINAAYGVLNHPKLRQEYDQLRRAYVLSLQSATYHATVRQPAAPKPAPPPYTPPQSAPFQPHSAAPSVRSRNPYRFILACAGLVLLINVGFIMIFLSGAIDLPLLSDANQTPNSNTVNAIPTATLAPSPSLPPFQPSNTCTNRQISIRAPQSAQYTPNDMPLPLSVLIALPDAYTYQVVLVPDNADIPFTLKPISALGDTFTGELSTLPSLDLQSYGVGIYEVELMVYNQNRQEIASCAVRLLYIEN